MESQLAWEILFDNEIGDMGDGSKIFILIRVFNCGNEKTVFVCNPVGWIYIEAKIFQLISISTFLTVQHKCDSKLKRVCRS